MGFWRYSKLAYLRNLRIVLPIGALLIIIDMWSALLGGALWPIDLLAAAALQSLALYIFHYDILYVERPPNSLFLLSNPTLKTFYLRYCAVAGVPIATLYVVGELLVEDTPPVLFATYALATLAAFAFTIFIGTVFPAVVAAGDTSFKRAVERGQTAWKSLFALSFAGPLVILLPLATLLGIYSLIAGGPIVDGEINIFGLIGSVVGSFGFLFVSALFAGVFSQVYCDIDGAPG